MGGRVILLFIGKYAFDVCLEMAKGRRNRFLLEISRRKLLCRHDKFLENQSCGVVLVMDLDPLS